MTYRITGLAPSLIDRLRGLSDDEIEALGARRVRADADRGYPCRASLRDASKGESLILFNHVSHDVSTPYRSSYAIYVREDAAEAARYDDAVPPVFDGRPLALRCFDRQAMLRDAVLAAPGEADAAIRRQFENEAIAYVDVHNAAHGCFAARVERS